MSSESYYAVSAGTKFEYVAIIKKQFLKNGKPYAGSLDLGGVKRVCVRISVNVPDLTNEDERFRNTRGSEVAVIHWIGYSEECSLTSDMPSGEGTRHMVRTAMTLVKKVFPWIERFRLYDSSNINCVDNSFKVSLADIQISLHGKTYYERYFGAYLEFESIRTDYLERVREMKTAPMLDFELFCRHNRVFSKEIESYIKGPYESSNSYADFFKQLQAKCDGDPDNKKYCFVTNEFLETFLTNKLSGRYKTTEWIIDMDKIRQVTYVSRAMTPDEIVKWGQRVEQHGGVDNSREMMNMTLGPLDMF